MPGRDERAAQKGQPRAGVGQRRGSRYTEGGSSTAPRKTSSDRQEWARKEGRWRLRNWRLRNKLAVVLLVPTLTAVALGGLRLKDELDDAASYDQTVRQVQLTEEISAVVHEVQGERNLMAQRAADRPRVDPGAADTQIKRVDAEVAKLSDRRDLLDGLAPSVQASYNRAVGRLTALQAVRSAATTSQYPDVGIVSVYADIIDALLQANREISRTTIDPDILQRSTAVDSLGAAKEQLQLQNSLLLITAQRGEVSDSDLTSLQAAEAQYQSEINSFRSDAGPVELERFNDGVAGPDVDERNRLKQLIEVRGENGDPLGVDPAQIITAGDNTANLMRSVEGDLLGQLRDASGGLASTAQFNAVRDGAAVLIALLIAFGLMLVVARAMLSPLRMLRTSALEVADTRLPAEVQRILADPNPLEAAKNAVEPVPVFTTEEIGQLARSFDAVHGEAVRLAAEQAILRENVNSMFVNLSRRSQTLVERQLGLIDRLEQDEQDPDQLANLFALDHLATRMRRNSENLLVLSGSGFGKRLNRPVAVGELVGAAVSEVEQYARIEVSPPPDIMVQGWVVNDLIHLVAELLDNATTYSEPDTKVSVRIARTRGQELAVQITDRGVGMPDEEVRSANERLIDPPDVDVSVSRRMGLYVVARLAKRHAIRVRLHSSEDIEGGLRATIAIPAELVTDAAQQRPSMADAFGGQRSPALTTEGSPSALPPAAASLPPLEDSFPSLRTSLVPTEKPDEGQHRWRGPQEVTGEQDRRAIDPPSGTAPADKTPTVRADLPQVSFVAGQDEHGASDVPPWATSDSEELRQLVAAWQQQGLEEQRQDMVERTGFTPAVGQGGRNGTHGTSDLPKRERGQHIAEPSAAVSAETTRVLGKPLAGREDVDAELDAPTERLPIYEAVLSQWFHAEDSQPLPTDQGDWATAADPLAPSAEYAMPDKQPEPPEPAATSGFGDPTDTGSLERTLSSALSSGPPPARSGRGADSDRTPGPLSDPEGFAAQRPAEPAAPLSDPMPAGEGRTNKPGRLGGDKPLPKRTPAATRGSWDSPADDGWKAAESLLESARDEALTSAGLPKRVPKAHLVPGSAPAKPQPGETGPPGISATPPRSADSMRNRMSSFQQGIRRGRHSMMDALAAERFGSESKPASDPPEEDQE